MSKAFALLWVLAIVVPGGFLVSARKVRQFADRRWGMPSSGCEFRALSLMPAGFRLGDSNWVRIGAQQAGLPGTISGLYADRQYEKGARICPQQLLNRPVIPPPSENRVSVVLSPVAIEGLNAGAIVDIWSNSKRVAESTRVLAILCPKTCSAMVVEVHPDAAAALADTKNLIFSVRYLP